MKPTVVLSSLVLLNSAFALPQASPSTAQEMVAASIADLRGVSDAFEIPRNDSALDRKALWLSALNAPIVSAPLPPARHPTSGTVSAQRLRHHPPKVARKAYEKALHTKDMNQAVRDLQSALALDPDFADAHVGLGVAYTRLGQYPEAAAEFRRAIELVPDEAIPHSNLAWALLSMGQMAAAEASVRRALQLSPQDAEAHLLIGRILIQTTQTRTEGLGHLEYAARSMPEARQIIESLR